MVDTERLGALSGGVSPAWSLGAILLATIVSPGFSWTGNALSNLGADTGVATPLTMLLFDGGLVTGGLLGLPFAAFLFRRARNRPEQVGAAAVGMALVSMAGVGLFPQGRALHAPTAIGFYLLATAALASHGLGTYLAGERRVGLVSVAAAVGHLAFWALWIGTGAVADYHIAIPEMVGAVVFGAWVALTAVRHRRADLTE